MIEHVWSVLCESGSIDSQSNRVSMFDVVEVLTVYAEAREAVQIPIKLEVFSYWVRSEDDQPESGKMRVYYCDPKGECSSKLELAVDLTKSLFHRTRVTANGMTLKGEGRYFFIVDLQKDGEETWTTVARIPVIVKYDQPKEQKTLE